jgi:hypothetical protein
MGLTISEKTKERSDCMMPDQNISVFLQSRIKKRGLFLEVLIKETTGNAGRMGVIRDCLNFL